MVGVDHLDIDRRPSTRGVSQADDRTTPNLLDRADWKFPHESRSTLRDDETRVRRGHPKRREMKVVHVNVRDQHRVDRVDVRRRSTASQVRQPASHQRVGEDPDAVDVHEHR
jgi:hypothetical protein